MWQAGEEITPLMRQAAGEETAALEAAIDAAAYRLFGVAAGEIWVEFLGEKVSDASELERIRRFRG